MRNIRSVPGYLDERISLELHDGAITITQVHEQMGDSTDSIYLEPDHAPALIAILTELHAADIGSRVPTYSEDADQ